MDLIDIDASAWAELETAAAGPQSGFRYVNLCSVGAEGRPQARMVVLRAADRARRSLEFHTDTRSPKWLELSANPDVTVLGFCPQARLQLRLQGTVERHGPGSERADAAWENLPNRTRMTYIGGPPGDERAFETVAELPEPRGEVEGKARFGVLSFRARMLDWFQLRQQDNRRALFSYDETGALTHRRWVNP
ncbi:MULTISPECIES: pyridoxamine 5'-phosphate oxidase family protein [Rhizobium]|uniref:pyridoxamine 5'-phosphate oxidase family protein n=1 Tax=Rhizobium TaxID=379 RepID=UPI001B325B67|nr:MULTISPECIES: pyridoxamine 5'-phosphate oxidase family protein [Rhizobium]MBX4908933.1 pyridoxamine 5'-phosphate oxidase [Rhizobium bangladeshense]MBX5216066.1 pyridoxamine 5'-phosphate oxidase [Rhizobium sp. NLR9a]MBX5234445.1 pyridoxamine 5'-phosphate oxidase [Rhizobium sp. NLR4a]MBX5239085.1 pyridoxamine 5'-phosphate oxidase [Rhizobium sp. NLR22b]MBX5246765.1 pyridoxamine 5'-phosphate oxidase [Rhizobium sp. NLR3b]